MWGGCVSAPCTSPGACAASHIFCFLGFLRIGSPGSSSHRSIDVVFACRAWPCRLVLALFSSSRKTPHLDEGTLVCCLLLLPSPHIRTVALVVISWYKRETFCCCQRYASTLWRVRSRGDVTDVDALIVPQPIPGYTHNVRIRKIRW